MEDFVPIRAGDWYVKAHVEINREGEDEPDYDDQDFFEVVGWARCSASGRHVPVVVGPDLMTLCVWTDLARQYRREGVTAKGAELVTAEAREALMNNAKKTDARQGIEEYVRVVISQRTTPNDDTTADRLAKAITTSVLARLGHQDRKAA